MRRKEEMIETYVFALGGSVITKDNYKHLPEIAQSLMDFSSRNRRLYVVTGGGTLARQYIDIVKNSINNIYVKRDTTISQEDIRKILDEVGIEATRMHARLLASLFKYKRYKIPETIRDAVKLIIHYRIPVMGGVKPGISTDAVAAELASRIKAKELIVVSDVDGIYQEDPKSNPNAEKISRMTYDELWEIIKNFDQSPGNYMLFDHQAFKIVKENKIPVRFISYKNIKNPSHAGTIVK